LNIHQVQLTLTTSRDVLSEHACRPPAPLLQRDIQMHTQLKCVACEVVRTPSEPIHTSESHSRLPKPRSSEMGNICPVIDSRDVPPLARVSRGVRNIVLGAERGNAAPELFTDTHQRLRNFHLFV